MQKSWNYLTAKVIRRLTCLGYITSCLIKRQGSCLVLSCLVLSCLVLSCLVLSCLVLSCLVLSCLVLSCLVLLEYWPKLLMKSNSQGWVCKLVGLLVMYQSLSKFLWFLNMAFWNIVVQGRLCGILWFKEVRIFRED